MEQARAGVGWIIMWYPRAIWYELSETERQHLMDACGRVARRAEATGATLLGSFYCRGQSECEGITCWILPDLTAIEAFSDDLDRAGFRTYFVTRCFVGTCDDGLFGAP